MATVRVGELRTSLRPSDSRSGGASVRTGVVIAALVVMAGCTSARPEALTTGTVVGTSSPIVTSTSVSSRIPPSSAATTSTGPILKTVEVQNQLAELDGPARLWRMRPMSADPDRIARWGRAFGFTDDEIRAAAGEQIARHTPDGPFLAIDGPGGTWRYVDGPAGMYANPNACTVSTPTAPSTTVTSSRCSAPPPAGVPDPASAEARARALWATLGVDVSDATVSVGGDDHLREVVAADDLDGAAFTRLDVVIGPRWSGDASVRQPATTDRRPRRRSSRLHHRPRSVRPRTTRRRSAQQPPTRRDLPNHRRHPRLHHHREMADPDLRVHRHRRRPDHAPRRRPSRRPDQLNERDDTILTADRTPAAPSVTHVRAATAGPPAHDRSVLTATTHWASGRVRGADHAGSVQDRRTDDSSNVVGGADRASDCGSRSISDTGWVPRVVSSHEVGQSTSVVLSSR